ncbi:ras and Rab interactor 3 isoform X2 [Cololabis saira]|uniref:ras and Rab interactor 3 isoform X2 n=1 Tax=Cololabis saira TaxID=129043 RepID=UPI002AD42A0D|nr:ras and Rab interactor 3 isoform X2 [Cololabis saira]
MAVHSSINGTTAIPWRSSRRRLTLLEQLSRCQDAWSPGAPWDRGMAHAAVSGSPAGSFLVVRDSVTSQPSLLCVSAGGQNDQVLDYGIKCTGTVLQLSDSHLSFSDLPQLVFFYSLTRDVLDVCLSVPHWIYSMTDTNRLSQLEPETWLSTPTEQQTEEISHMEPNTMMCSIQLTSTSGALCIINPLYLREHGDEWLTHRTAQPPTYRRERRLSSTRTWAGAGVQSKRTISLDQESSAAWTESSGLTRARSADSSTTPNTPVGVVLRRPSRDLAMNPPQRATGSRSTPSSPRSVTPEPQRHSSPMPTSPHRVSWIEDGFWLPPPRPSSLLQPPELDSLSVSSMEDEPDSLVPGPAPHHTSANRLADKLKHRISAVGQALGGLVCQKKKLTNRVKELSEKKGGAFAEAVKAFVDSMLKAGSDPSGVTVSEFLQDLRSSLTSLRETLLDTTDFQALLDSITDFNDSEIDYFVELSLHKVALKPIAAHLYTCIHNLRTKDNTFEHLTSNQRVLEKKGVEELGGTAGAGVPDPVTLERIHHKWTSMHETYSPSKKVQIVLKVCKTIYHSMSANASSGTAFGADDFLPCLTWVLLRSNLVTLQVDTDYMMELLDPTQLQGEGGYYLTTLYASLYYISSFQPRVAARQLSVEAQKSINQWHRRRTLHCNQSRRSKNRRTIRRLCREAAVHKSETETGNKENATDDVDTVEQPTGRTTEDLSVCEEETESEQELNSQTDTTDGLNAAAGED